MTPEELALLTTIAEEPHNRVAGLVWCDWVRERPEIGHNQDELDWLTKWLYAERGDRSALVRSPAVVEALYRSNCHPVEKDRFYALKAKILRAYGEMGGVKVQEIIKRCWGCHNCQNNGYEPKCDGDGVYSINRHYLQEYRFGRATQLTFLVPMAYPPAWSEITATDPPDIVGRVPIDPTVSQDQSFRSMITLAVATPWLRLNANYSTRPLLTDIVNTEFGLHQRIAWIHEEVA
jgi:hypothetical protein